MLDHLIQFLNFFKLNLFSFKHIAMDSVFISPPSHMLKLRAQSGSVLGDGALARRLGLEGGALMSGIVSS